MIARSMTAEDFAGQRFDLPEAGRWCELVAGEPMTLDPPSAEHGNAVLNLSRALAEWLDRTRDGFLCFDLGLLTRRAPDTVRFPAICYFVTGNRWDMMDVVYTDQPPVLIVDVVSTPDRRRHLRERIEEFQQWGVAFILIVEPRERRLTLHGPAATTATFRPGDTLTAADWSPPGSPRSVLPGFAIPVEDIFREPDWWTGRKAP